MAEGDAEDINRAVRAARRAFEDGPWSRMTPSDRGRLIWKIGDLILEHADELAQLESLDNGKPVGVARAADVPLAADLFHYMAGWATKIEGNTINISVPYMPGANFHSYTLREPVGVVGQIIPWNFPLLMAAWKLGPALTTGNCVVLKPAEQTPLTALLLAQLIAEAGIPDGVVNVVTGFGETAGAALAAHDDVDKVAFTGSTEVGKLIVQAAAGNLKKVTLELGGKSPNIVFDDAESGAVEGAANAIFFNHGQCCVAGSRLFVQEDRFDEVVNGVAEIAKGIKLGPGMESGTQMGPLVSEEQLQRVTGFLESGLAEGATTVTGGGRFGDNGYFVEPTVIASVRLGAVAGVDLYVGGLDAEPDLAARVERQLRDRGRRDVDQGGRQAVEIEPDAVGQQGEPGDLRLPGVAGAAGLRGLGADDDGRRAHRDQHVTVLAVVRDHEGSAAGERHRGAVGPACVQVQADQLGHVVGAGLAGDQRRGALLHDAAAFEDDDLVGQHERLYRVVGDQQARAGEVGQVPLELGLDVEAGAGVEGRKRFVQQQQGRPPASARARATRCACPPDSWLGLRSARSVSLSRSSQ